jgi:DNA-binding IclR family transcriptional regulator
MPGKPAPMLDDSMPQRTGAAEPAPPRVQSVARAMAILGAVADSPHGLRAMEIAAALGLGRQATYHLLHTLVACGMLTRNRQNLYVLGLRTASLADAFERQMALPEHLAPLVRRIAAETGETAYAAGWRAGEIVNLVSAPGSNPIQAMTVPQGFSGHAHARATGKLLLAHAPDDLRERYLAGHELAPRTPHTVTSRDALDAELARVRADGFATDRQEFAPGLCCLAVPIGRTAAGFAIGLSAPVDRFEARFGDYLRIMLELVRRW